MENHTFIDLFAGAGGLSEGFIKEGFIPIAHIEKDLHACNTLRTRMAYHYLNEINSLNIYEDYISGNMPRDKFYELIPQNIIKSVINEEINNENLDILFNRIHEMLDLYCQNNIDVVIGGPPCQAYSLVGRARDPYSMEKDPRNYLYKLYSRFLNHFKPSVFIFENVPGLLSAGKGKLIEDVKHYFDKCGYKFNFRTLDASEHGVLQSRKRIILIGWKKELSLEYPDIPKETNKGYVIKDLFLDLPSLIPGEQIHYGDYITDPSEYLISHQIRDNGGKLLQHITRKHNGRDLNIYRMAIEKWNREQRRLSYDEVPEEYRTHKNTNSFLDRYKVVAENMPFSHTMVAHISKDGHYYIHPDINQVRSLSVREAARIQSFPDNYYFEGSMSDKFRQIGNAVPPLMSEKIASAIKEMLDE